MPFSPNRYSLAQNRANVAYSDFTMDMDVSPSTGDLILIIDDDSIKASVINLALTNKYERPFRPRIGGGASRALFEMATPSSTTAFKDSVVGSIENHEPRARLPAVSLVTDQNSGKMSLTIFFQTIKSGLKLSTSSVIGRAR